MQEPYWQTGIIVRDLDAALAELSQARGLTWSDVVEFKLAGRHRRVAFSREGPPYLELIQELSADVEPRIDHFGWWSDDVDADIARVRAAGAELELDGREHGRAFVMLRQPATGIGIELVDRRARDLIGQTFGIEL